MKILLILNEAPYGSEKTYNALRLAMALQKDQPSAEISTMRQLEQWTVESDKALVF